MLSQLAIANSISKGCFLPAANGNVKLSIRNGKGEVQATNLEHWYVAYAAFPGWQDMDVIVQTDRLMSAYQLLGQVSGTLNGTELHLTGKGSMKIALEEAGQFPDIAYPGEVDSYLPTFQDMSWATSGDDLKPAMTGIYVGEDMVATDGAKMAIRKKVQGPGVVVPPAAFKWPGNIQVTGKHVFVVGDDYFYGARLIDAKYPPYKSILSNRQGCPVMVIPKDISKALGNRLLLESGSVCLGNGFLMAHNRDKGIDVRVDADIVTEHEVWVNPRFLQDALNWIPGDSITFTMDPGNPSTRPLMFEDDERIAMIMPIVSP